MGHPCMSPYRFHEHPLRFSYAAKRVDEHQKPLGSPLSYAQESGIQGPLPPGDQVDVGVPELELAASPQIYVAVAPAHVVDLDGIAPFSQRLDQVRRN